MSNILRLLQVRSLMKDHGATMVANFTTDLRFPILIGPRMPCQLVFPDDTMAIGSPALPRQNLFPTDCYAAMRGQFDGVISENDCC